MAPNIWTALACHEFHAVLLTIIKLSFYCVAWSTGFTMPTTCISPSCCLKAACRWMGTGLKRYWWMVVCLCFVGACCPLDAQHCSLASSCWLWTHLTCWLGWWHVWHCLGSFYAMCHLLEPIQVQGWQQNWEAHFLLCKLHLRFGFVFSCLVPDGKACMTQSNSHQ